MLLVFLYLWLFIMAWSFIDSFSHPSLVDQKGLKKYSGDEKENEDILRDLWYVFYKSDPSGELLYQLSLVPSYLPWVEGIRERISDDISAAWRY